jgi:diguanylate cyclase (GGDEF)-like protein
MTISIGVAQSDASMPTFDTLLKHADEAVYEAKAAGRNRVHAHTNNAQNKKRTA